MEILYIVLFATVIAFASSEKERFNCVAGVDIGPKKTCSCRELRGMCFRIYKPACDTSGKSHSNFCMMCSAVGKQIQENGRSSIRFAYEGLCR